MFYKKGILRNFARYTERNLCQSLFFNKVAGLRPITLLKMRLWHRCFPDNFIKKETLAQVFSCEFCEISNTFFHRTPLVAASAFHYFVIENWKSLHFLSEYFFRCKHNSSIFYHHRNAFNFVSNIFFITFYVGRITEETCALSLKKT